MLRRLRSNQLGTAVRKAAQDGLGLPSNEEWQARARHEEVHMAEWNDRIQDAADRAEDEVKRLIRYMNDEVVPDVRRHSSSALKAAAEQLHKLAQTMDDRK